MACLPPGVPIASLFTGGWCDGRVGGGGGDDWRGFTVGFVDAGAMVEVLSTMSATRGWMITLPPGCERGTRERIAAWNGNGFALQLETGY